MTDLVEKLDYLVVDGVEFELGEYDTEVQREYTDAGCGRTLIATRVEETTLRIDGDVERVSDDD